MTTMPLCRSPRHRSAGPFPGLRLIDGQHGAGWEATWIILWLEAVTTNANLGSTTRFPRKFPRKFPCSSRFSIAKKFHRFMSFTGRRPTSRRPRDEVMWAECCSDNEGDAPNGGKLDRRMLTAKGARANCTANVNITWLKFGGLSKVV